jgi:hypothetical protein
MKWSSSDGIKIASTLMTTRTSGAYVNFADVKGWLTSDSDVLAMTTNTLFLKTTTVVDQRRDGGGQAEILTRRNSQPS